jgi:replication factor C subunit 1
LTCHGSNRTINDIRRIVDSSEHISLGDIIEKKIKTTNEWTLLPNRGTHSALAPATYSGNFISYTKFPELFGKFSKMRKILRQLKEMKQIFNYSFKAIKDEIVPLLLSKIANYLIDLGKEGVSRVISVLHTHKISLMLFKENLFDLQTNDSITQKYEKLNPSIKSLLTKKLNEEFKTSIVAKKNKSKKLNFYFS